MPTTGKTENPAPMPPDTSTSKRAFLDAAEDLLSQRGYNGMSISAVCKAADLPVGSLYWHFKNKADLVVELLKQSNERFFDSLPSGTELRGSPRARLKRYYAKAADEFDAAPRFLRVLHLLSLEECDDLDVRSQLQQLYGAVVEHIAEVIEPVAREAGLPDPVSTARELAILTVRLTGGTTLAHSLGSESYSTGLRRAVEVVLAMIDQSSQSHPVAQS